MAEVVEGPDIAPRDRAASWPRLRLGSAPDSWGVWFATDSRQTPWSRFLDELVEAGYHWLELGPYGYLPTDPTQLCDEIGGRGLELSGGTVAGALHRSGDWTGDLEAARRVAALVHAAGARYLVYLPEMYRDSSGRFNGPTELSSEEWRRLVTRLDELGRIVRDELGVSLVVHPHADSHVASPEQVERLLADTTADAVSLCLDTGHISYCGGDNLDLIERFGERIGYVHLKQVDPVLLARVRAERLSFTDAVRLGVMCEPPRGIPAMEPLVDALGSLDADLFAIVEQDLYPCDPDVPLPIARRTRRYLGYCGLGAGGHGP